MGCVWVYTQKVELRCWWEYGDEKTGINWLNDEGLTLETSAFLSFTVANLRFQLSC